MLCLQISDAISDATRAISARDAPSLAIFFRNLFDPAASRAGPQHVCLKRAFALLESRWNLDAKEGAYQLPTTGHHEPPVPFGGSSLSPEVFVSVVEFLDVHQTMQSARTSKAWWRNGRELERFQPFVLEYCVSDRAMSAVLMLCSCPTEELCACCAAARTCLWLTAQYRHMENLFRF